MTNYIQPDIQLPFSDWVDVKADASRQVVRQFRKVADLQSNVRRLADELNALLYVSKMSELPCIHSPKDAADILIPFMTNLDREELWVLCLNTRNRLLHVARIYSGSVNNSQVRVGEIFRVAIIQNSTSILIAHNHPSGDPSPSPEDVSLTRAIVQAGKLLDLEVLDHLVIGAGLFVSLKERGLGF